MATMTVYKLEVIYKNGTVTTVDGPFYGDWINKEDILREINKIQKDETVAIARATPQTVMA